MRSRFLALYPGGCISKELLAKERSAVLVVGDTLFTHAGLRIQHLARYARAEDALRDLNLEMSAYFAGQIPQISEKTNDVIWTRAYGQVIHDAVACESLCTIVVGASNGCSGMDVPGRLCRSRRAVSCRRSWQRCPATCRALLWGIPFNEGTSRRPAMGRCGV